MHKGRNYFFVGMLAFLFVIYNLPAFCQSLPGLNSIVKQFNSAHDLMPPEKLYLRCDKSTYLQDDTIWFKAYLLNADYLTASTRSGLLYVELDDLNNNLIKRLIFPVNLGLSWGDIVLGNDIPEGGYVIRAYTNWMRNFGEDNLFKKYIYIASAQNHSRLITANFDEIKHVDKTNIRVKLLFSDMNKLPVILQDMQVDVKDGGRSLIKANAETDVAGKMDVNFELPANIPAKDVVIITRDITKKSADTTSAYIIPVILNRPQNTDLQFMPEGGDLVAGISSHIGFKAIGEDGKGVDAVGKIVDNKQQVVATFRSTHNGMGAFDLIPLSGQHYTALLSLPDGTVKSYALPTIRNSGTTINIVDTPGDSLKVTVSVTPDLLAEPIRKEYYLIGRSRDLVCYAAHIAPENNTTVTYIPKSAFPIGIAHFTLLNAVIVPLNERIIYIEHHDNLRITIESDKKIYSPHDSVALHISVSDKFGNPIRGSFCMAVTDDNQVKTDSLGSNIVNDLLLTSNLKGTVEEPGYYLSGDDPQRKIELDNLLLTQGWISYEQKKSQPIYPAEKEFSIQGKVTNAFNKPVIGAPVTLLSKKPFFVADTVTNSSGQFIFKGFLPVDTASFMIQARNKHGNSFNVGIEINEFKPPLFTETNQRMLPWYINSDPILLNDVNNRITKQQKEEKLQGFGHILKEVTVRGKKIIRNSKNLNGPGGADQSLDEQDMLRAGKMSLGDLLSQKIKGFNTARNYRIDDEPVFFVFDGIILNRLYSPTGEMNGLYDFIKGYMDYYTAEDILGVEVMSGARYNSKYIIDFLDPRSLGLPISFIEITTRSGQGPYMHHTPGTYLYKPLVVTLSKTFYRPKYDAKDVVTGTDLRSTIHWESNIVTDTAGKATVSFYSADKPATYTIVVEGTDMNGSLGYKQQKVQVH